MAELVDRYVQIDQHRLAVHEGGAGVPAEQLARVALRVVLGEIAAVDDADRAVVGVDHGHGVQVLVFHEQAVHVVIGVLVQQGGGRLDLQAGGGAARRALGQWRGRAHPQRIAQRLRQLGQQRLFGAAQQPALGVADVQLAHHGQVLGRLDAFGHDGGAQVLGDLEDGAHHVLLAVVLADATEEVAVDLDQIGLHLGPQLQVGIAHAVVVQRDAHAVVAQAGEGAAQRGHVLGQRILLGQLDDDAGGFERAILEQPQRHFVAPQRPVMDQGGAGQVQEQLALGTCFMEAMGAGAEAGQFQLGMQALAAGLGKQGVGKVQRRVRRAAYQAFMAVDAALGQVDDGLEAGLQEAFAQDAGQTGVTRPHCRNGMGAPAATGRGKA